MLLDGINHVAWISKDIARLGRFYAEVFDADVRPAPTHGKDGKETMTIFRDPDRLEGEVLIAKASA